MRRSRIVYNAVLTVVLLVSVVWILPIAFSVVNSFKDYNSIIAQFFSMPERVDFGIYAETWTLLGLGEKFANTLLYTVVTTLATLLLAPMAAYKLGRVKNKTSTVLTLVFALPIMVPFTTYCVPLSMLMGRVGLTNTRLGYILASIGLSIPFCVHIIRGFVDGIPYEIEECAQIDGAKPFRLFFCIVYPMLVPAIVTVGIVVAVSTWNDLLVCKVLASSSDSLLNIQTKLYSRFSQGSSDWTHAFPAIVLSFLPTIVFFLCMQEKVVAGVSAGAVKG
jgi:raffinose/stachyose/melibiose transport system permease protein